MHTSCHACKTHVFWSSPPPDPLAKRVEEKRESSHCKAKSTNTDERVSLTHTRKPRLDAPGDAKSNNITDQNNGSDHLCVEQRVAVQDVRHRADACHRQPESNEPRADDWDDSVDAICRSDAVYDETGWEDDSARHESPESEFRLSVAAITPAEVQDELIIQRAGEVCANEGADHWADPDEAKLIWREQIWRCGENVGSGSGQHRQPAYTASIVETTLEMSAMAYNSRTVLTYP